MTDRLLAANQRRFAGGAKLWPESSVPPVDALRRDVILIQVTALEPQIDAASAREGLFASSTNLRLFAYDVPFTAGGKAHGALREQMRRRVTLSVDMPFPSLLRRVGVVERSEAVLNPLQCAADILAKRIAALQQELRREKKDAKALQVKKQTQNPLVNPRRAFCRAPSRRKSMPAQAKSSARFSPLTHRGSTARGRWGRSRG